MKISSKKKETLPTEQNVNSSESVKVFYNDDKNIILNEHVEYTSQRFSGVLRQSLSTEEYERIWVCGPPPMNEEMVNLFDSMNLSVEKYLIM